MPIDFDGIFAELFNKGIIIAAVVSRRNGEIVHISSNWSVDPTDLKKCIDNWQKKSAFTKLQDRKYSLLMNNEDYFSGVNYKDRDYLLGAASPEENALSVCHVTKTRSNDSKRWGSSRSFRGTLLTPRE